MKRRVVITGLGVIAPNGIGKEAFWDALVNGRSGIGRVNRIIWVSFNMLYSQDFRIFLNAIDTNRCYTGL